MFERVDFGLKLSHCAGGGGSVEHLRFGGFYFRPRSVFQVFQIIGGKGRKRRIH